MDVTGNYPSKAGTADELRSDRDVAYSLLPGSHYLNLRAIYLESLLYTCFIGFVPFRLDEAPPDGSKLMLEQLISTNCIGSSGSKPGRRRDVS